MLDDRDLVIQDLSVYIHRLESDLLDATQDRNTFRDLLSESLTRLRRTTDQLDKAAALLRQFLGEPRTFPAALNPWYPPIEDQTDVSQMVRADEIRWE